MSDLERHVQRTAAASEALLDANRPRSHGSTSQLRRVMLTIDDKRCPFGCTYCFRDFSQYTPPPTLAAVEGDTSLLHGIDVVYPACDVDIFARTDALSVLGRVSLLGRTISVSTKASLSTRDVAAIHALDSQLRSIGALLKVAVSIATKDTQRFEPRASRYEARLRTLSLLRSAGVPTALIMRPLLLDVSADEHVAILREAGQIAGAVVVGDEWVDNQVDQRRSVSFGAYETRRTVNWIHGEPDWTVRPADERAAELRAVASELGIGWFESDLDLIDSLLAT